MKKTKIINIFGGPGIGKSTTAARVYSELQLQGYSCDLPYEFPKQVAWEDNKSQITDQFYICANQHRGIVRSYGKVDFIIVDSPILLSVVYKDRYHVGYPTSLYGDTFDKFVLEVFKGYENINYIIHRETKEYEEEGRLQTQDESVQIDNEIILLLDECGVDYHPIRQTPSIGVEISNHIINNHKTILNVV